MTVHYLIHLYVGLGSRTEVLTFAQRAPHPQSQLCSPGNSHFMRVLNHTLKEGN